MDVHDSRDGEDLYRTLHDELIPLYYQRDRDGLRWVDQAHEANNPHAGLALQRRPHGHGLHAEVLYPAAEHKQRDSAAVVAFERRRLLLGRLFTLKSTQPTIAWK